MDITRATGPHGIDAPLQWRKCNLDGELAVHVTCSNGHESFLDHDIDAAGNVTPSLVCMWPNCDFHESNVKLIGWEP